MASLTHKTVCTAVALAAAAAIVASGVPAYSQSTSQRLDATRRHAQRVKSDYERIASAWADQQTAIGNTSDAMARTETAIARGEEQKKSLRAQLSKRVRLQYQMGGLGMFDLLLNARSFDE